MGAHQAPRVLVHNAGDPDQVARAERAELRGRARELEDLRRVFLQSAAGRRVAWRLLQRTFTRDSTLAADVVVMAARCGMRDVGLWLQAELEQADPFAMTAILDDATRETHATEEQAAAGHVRPAHSDEDDDEQA